MAPTITFKKIPNFDTLNNFKFYSDHRLIYCKLNLTKERFHPKPSSTLPKINKFIRLEYQGKLESKLREMEKKALSWEQLQEVIRETSESLTPPNTKELSHNLPKNIRDMISKREMLKKMPKTLRNKIKFGL